MKNKALIISLIAIPPIIAVGYYVVKKKQAKKQVDDLMAKLNAIAQSASPAAAAAQAQIQVTPSTAPGMCGYPLKKGSKNPCVKQLQNALINSYGPDVLPKYGADGDWGDETETAMINKTGVNVIGSPQQLNEMIVQIITQKLNADALTYGAVSIFQQLGIF